MNYQLKHVCQWLLRAVDVCKDAGRRAWMCVWLALVLVSPAYAQSAEGGQPADEEPVIAEVSEAGAVETEDAALQAEQAAAREQLLRDITRMQQALDEQRAELGAYHPSLLELQRDLSRALLDVNDAGTAADILAESLQLARITDGLYSDQQVAILDALIEAHGQLQDWQQVDNFVHLRFSLQTRGLAEDSPAYAQALLQQSDWQLQASRRNLLGRPGSALVVQQLMTLNQQHEAALLAARQRQAPRDEWDLLTARALTEVEIARQLNYQGQLEPLMYVPRYITQTVCRTVPDGAGGSQRVCWQERVSNPDYYFSAQNQRRTQLERARLNLQASRREMEIFLADNPGFASDNVQETTDRIASLERIVTELQRELRRMTLRDW